MKERDSVRQMRRRQRANCCGNVKPICIKWKNVHEAQHIKCDLMQNHENDGSVTSPLSVWSCCASGWLGVIGCTRNIIAERGWGYFWLHLYLGEDQTCQDTCLYLEHDFSFQLSTPFCSSTVSACLHSSFKLDQLMRHRCTWRHLSNVFRVKNQTQVP